MVESTDLDWHRGRLHDFAYSGYHYIVRLPCNTYIVYRLDHDYQLLYRVGLFYEFNDVLSVINHDERSEV